LLFAGGLAYRTMSSAMLTANFPTLVPPNFWTTQPRLLLFFRRALAAKDGDEAS
jgi:hypothetical protein